MVERLARCLRQMAEMQVAEDRCPGHENHSARHGDDAR